MTDVQPCYRDRNNGVRFQRQQHRHEFNARAEFLLCDAGTVGGVLDSEVLTLGARGPVIHAAALISAPG